MFHCLASPDNTKKKSYLRSWSSKIHQKFSISKESKNRQSPSDSLDMHDKKTSTRIEILQSSIIGRGATLHSGFPRVYHRDIPHELCDPVADDDPMDPIMLTVIKPEEPVYEFCRPNGKIVKYRVETLIDYMISSGKFVEPETNLIFPDSALKQLDSIAREYHMKKPSVYASKYNNSLEYLQHKFDENAATGLERCCGEFVAKIPDILISDASREDCQLILLTHVFPEIRHYYLQLKSVDEYAAKIAKFEFRTFIQGPPNKPYEDSKGLLPMCFQFLDDLE